MIPSEEHVQIYINGGHTDYTMRGILDILPINTYVNYNSMAKILSLKEVEDSSCVIMDNK